ncbi:MAG: NIPSNAP family protein [Caldilineaceae bacterium]
MLTNRRTFTAKPGQMEELIDVLKAGGGYLEKMPTFRVAQALFGQNNRAVLELDFDDLAHYERFWTAWGPHPSQPGSWSASCHASRPNRPMRFGSCGEAQGGGAATSCKW